MGMHGTRTWLAGTDRPRHRGSPAAAAAALPIHSGRAALAFRFGFALSLAAGVRGGAEPVLERVFLLTRHGERTELRKTQVELRESGLAAITNSGRQSLVKLGKEVRERYQALGLDAKLSAGIYSRAEIHVESSALDRSLESASALHLGLFPPTGNTEDTGLPSGYQPVPVHSRPEVQDFVLRGYHDDRCPKFTEHIRNLHASKDFTEKARETEELRTKVGYILGQAPAGLDGWWNTVEELDTFVRKAQGSVGGASGPQTVQEARELLGWIEHQRFSTPESGPLCGGALLGELARHMGVDASEADMEEASMRSGPWARLKTIAHLQSRPKAQDQGFDLPMGQSNFKLVHFSAHYPTILCLLGAANAEVTGEGMPRTIPSFGSALSIEVLRYPNKTRTVRFVLKDGGSSPWVPVRIPCTRSTYVTGPECTIGPLLDRWQQRSLLTEYSWCLACVLSCGIVDFYESAEVAASFVAFAFSITIMCTWSCTVACIITCYLKIYRHDQEKARIPLVDGVELSEEPYGNGVDLMPSVFGRR